MYKDLTVEQRLERSHVQLMKDKRFVRWSGLFMIGKVEVRDDIPTACTNGRDVLYGRKFCEELTEKELNFLVMHEAMHKAYRHLTTWKHLFEEDRRCAGAACDYVINQQLVDYDPNQTMISMIECGLIDEEYRGMDTQQIYDILRKQKKEKGKGRKPGDGETGDDGLGGFDEHDFDGAKELGEEEKKVLTRQIEDALRQGGMLAGKLGANADKQFDELVDPKVDWKDVFRQWCKAVAAGRDRSTWRKPNRRFLHNDIIMPSMESVTLGRIVVGIDTSGSIGMRELAEFYSELVAICTDVMPECVDLLYWDTKIASHETYSQDMLGSIVQTTKPKGGGGTDPDCIPVYIKEKRLDPVCVVILTDGYIGRCEEDLWTGLAPTLWVVTENKGWKPPYGQSVNM
jgi:predicted metal-dependent peptidase